MSTKQNGIDENTRAQRAKGNQYALNPYARGFRSNLHLLTADPLHLRHRDFETGPGPLWNLESRLRVFWGNTKSFLGEMHGDIDLRGISEKDLAFYEEPEENSKLTEAQKNALHVFRCIRQIQKRIYTNEPIYEEAGPIQYEPIGFKQDNDDESEFQIPAGVDLKPIIARVERHWSSEIALEMMHLVLAVIKYDFYDLIWPSTQRGAQQKETLQGQSILNKELADADAEKIRRLAKKYKQTTKNGTIKQIQKHWKGTKAPSYGKCQPVVSEFFPARKKSQ